jgi:photosynthetic reaction center cytochrome c subunit
MKVGSRRIIGVVGSLAACLLFVALANGQAGQGAQATRTPMAEEVFKKVDILKGIPVDEFMDTMGMFSAALSLNCIDCHVPESVGSWGKFADETPLKVTTRKMLTMVNDINKNNFSGVRSVTCYTCHRGDMRPKILPNLAAQYATPMEDANEVVMTNIPSGPTVDQVFDKYIQALGGAQRLAALTSYSAKGTYIGFETEQTIVPMEIYAKAPSQRAMVVKMAVGDNVRIFDGRTAWIAASDKPLPLYTPTGGNLEGARLDGILMFPAQLKGAFANWRVSATGIDDKLVRVLQGTNPRQPPVNFYFDNATGLLVRMLRFVDTAVGRVPFQVDYSDYRDVAGVKIPHKWILTWTNGQATSQLNNVQANAAIDASRFARPAPAPQPK